VIPGTREAGGAATAARIRSPIQTCLDALHGQYAALHDGEVATYIPELAKADPNWFGIALVTTDGCVYEVGDTRQPFTIQSISKPFTYGLALEDRGRAAVLAKVGVEPSGEAFNAISLAPGTGCPMNPMINAGAIATASMVAGHSPSDRLSRLLAVFSLYAGRDLSVDVAVYESERETGHRNRAIGHMLRNFDIIGSDPEPALNLYFQQCSIAVDCRDLGVMAATLANGGVNPLTGERAVRQEFVESMLSVMATCGMYDYAGEWVYWVGMPAKSGVAGGVLAVLPGQLGIGVFSPRLDARGNSVRGVAVCRDLSRAFNLHFLRVPRSARGTIRAQYGLSAVSSKRRRTEAERAALTTVGEHARVYELQGDMGFAGVEAVVRAVVEAAAERQFIGVDVRRVSRIEDCAATLFRDLLGDLEARGTQFILVYGAAHAKFVRALEEGLAARGGGRLRSFVDLDLALEWCETRLIAAHQPVVAGSGTVTLAEHQMCAGLSPDALAILEALLQPQHFPAGASILRRGDPADTLYLLMRGQVSVTVEVPVGTLTRLSTLPAGMAFGELAIVDHSPRTADVQADTAVECYALAAADFDRLGESHPAIKMRILQNLLRNLSRTVARLNQEIWTLSR